ncbi:uncharacterized protein I303_104350 [Kwoniella dejecticola CBS 10117]|uniref:RanBD1 domain-containing protein n=1 Tax=Kwoniella dejecticola CBS 10117 TaxID=1296121 RepID=A0A1A6A5K6_9TREE|nr:uncharacterized protein I303_04675 [Kwoniella dejecticola CBS 10117]OBR85340.1 hypothetical protein I303_04675 [Kwoniella dejecticola CBS 10117]
MAKRGADNQKTREGGDSDEEQVDDPGNRSTPLAPVEGRVIRGMPKRKGFGGAAPASVPAPASTASAPTTSSPFSGFSFGQTAAAPSTSSNPFAFGGASAPASTPAAAAPAPAANVASANPFAGFSFGKPADPTPAAAAPTPAAETPKSSTPAFGFGAKPSAPAPAPSTTSIAPAAAPPKPFANFSFGKPATASVPSPAVGASTTASSSAQLASKPFTFGSFAAPTASTSMSSSATQPPPSVPVTEAATAVKGTNGTSEASNPSTNGPTPSQSDPPPEGEVSYYTSLRGLNTSIASFLTRAVKDDPFIKLSAVLPALVKQYDQHLDEAAKKAGWKPEEKKTSLVNGGSADQANGISAVAAPTFKMPSAPASGGFSLPKAPTPTASSSTPSFGGFTPSATPGATTSGFTFGSAKPSAPAPLPAKQPETPKKPSSEVTQLVEDVISGKSDEKKEEAPKPFSFGSGVTSTSTPESSKKAPSSLFSFAPSGPLHPPTPESKTFSPSTTLENATPAKLGKFGPGGSQPQLAFGGAKSSPGQATPGTPASTANKPFSFGFGSGSGSGPSANASRAPKAAAAAPTFSFGASATPAPAPASTSGTPSFSFGSSSSTTAKPASTPAFGFGSANSNASATPSFSFGSKPAAAPAAPASGGFSFTPYTPKPAADAENEPIDNASGGELPPENAEPSKNLAETTGAGEENEDTLVEQRGKLNRLENGEFKLEGLGQFKLKRSKEAVDGKKKRRLLMRTDGSGHVILNMSVNASFNPTVEGPHLRFLGFDNDGKPVPYALRVKNADVAKKIQEELQKEIDVIKGE